ncbi:MAG: type II toxin-antitoxin system RelE/ParE family toxin [Flavobacteriales bacterium]|nr:type II toxin-antitoxin system RelE/ParE family toxin [Flavobacteriales bacterium]
MSYRVHIARDAEKDIDALPVRMVPRIVQAIRALGDEPRPSGCKKLKGSRSILWRIRVGNYRIIYAINDDVRIVEVREVGDRKEVYR